MMKSIVFSVLLLFILAESASAQNVSVLLPLNKTATWANRELYSGFFNINSTSTLQVDFAKVNKNVSFIVFQVHSHLYNITLFNNTLIKGSYVSGSNVGMYSNVKPKLDTFFIYNSNDVDLKIFVAVHGYTSKEKKTENLSIVHSRTSTCTLYFYNGFLTSIYFYFYENYILDIDKDPIPGGCNMEFPIPISPFLQTSYTKDYVLVDAAAARDSSDKTCNTLDKAFVLFYKMYLPERHFDVDNYFDGIKKMMTIESIDEFGEYIPENGYHMRRMLSAYPGTGAVYVAIAFSSVNLTAYSVYVPTVTYACAPLDDGSCDLLDDFLSQLLCASLLFFGLFMCYFGHRFFKTEMFLIGMVSGAVVTYILISLIANLNLPALLGASVLSGICFGAIWLLFWWFYGMPLFAVMLSTLNVGFLFASIIYYWLPGGLTALQLDLNFWTLFASVMLMTSLMLVSMTFLSNILCCAILGAYAAVFPMDYYFGSNLKYIIINTMRRATVPNFNNAILSPPFEWRDALMTLLWLVLAMTGFLFQHFHNRGRPPFPPPPRSVRPRMPGSTYYGATTPGTRRYGTPSVMPTAPQSERTPLLA